MFEFVSFHLAELAQGRCETTLLTNYGLISVILNSFGATAVVVLLNSFPPKLGMVFFLLTLYGSILGGNIAEMALAKSQDNFTAIIFQAILQLCAFVRSCSSPTFDTYATFTAINFSWLPILSYASNLSLFLCLAVLVLNHREFFYASE